MDCYVPLADIGTIIDAIAMGSSMNILMLAPFAFAPKATVSRRAFPIARALVERDHKVTILVPPHDNLADGGKNFVRHGVKVNNLWLKRATMWTPISAAWQMAFLARQRRPEVVHIFKPVGYAALAGMILYHISRLPLVVDSDDWEGTGGWNSVNRYPWHWKRFFDLQERWLPRHSRVVTVASRTLQTQMWGMGIPPEKVFYAPNCPGQDFFEQRGQGDWQTDQDVRARLGIGDAPMVIYVGHLTLGDDLDVALHAFAQVLDRLPQAKLVIVGTGNGMAGLHALAANLHLDGSVIFTGWIEHAQVPAYLATANVAIYPYRDTLINRAKCSIKILEYMAMGKAIVTSRVGQNLEYLEHNKSGILVEPGNVQEFASGMLAALGDPGLAAQLGKEAQYRVAHHFNWSQRVVEIERAYRWAIGTISERTTHQPSRYSAQS
jgi:glycosyltransferase involved in cell wall biosynthesis